MDIFLKQLVTHQDNAQFDTVGWLDVYSSHSHKEQCR